MIDNNTPESNDEIEEVLEVEPVTEKKSRKSVFMLIAAVAALALVGSAVVAVNGANQRAADADATARIETSVEVANAAHTVCVESAESSTAADDTAGYLAVVTDVFGDESEVLVAAETALAGTAHTAADCDAAKVTTLGTDVDPSDNADSIVADNTAAAATFAAPMDATADLDTAAAEALASAETLPAVYEAYAKSLKTLNATVKTGTALVEGELAKYVTDDQTKAATTAAKTATTAKEAATADLDLLDVAALEAATEALSDANTPLAKEVAATTKTAEAAKKKADDAAAAKAAAAKSSSSSSGSSSSSSGSTKSSSGSSGSTKSSGGSSSGSSSGGSQIVVPAPPKSTSSGDNWTGTSCGGADMITYRGSSGWTYASAKADSQAKGCSSFQ